MAALELIAKLQEELSKPKVSTRDVYCQTVLLLEDNKYRTLWASKKPYLAYHDDHLPHSRKRSRTSGVLHECPQCGISASDPEIGAEIFGLKSCGTWQSWCKTCRNKSWSDRRKQDSPATEDYTDEDFKVYNELGECLTDSIFPDYPQDENALYKEDSQIVTRMDSIYVCTPKTEDGKRKGLIFHDTLKKKTETWETAEERHRNHPLIGKREKLLQILARQHHLSPGAAQNRFGHEPTVKLFYEIKKDSPKLLMSLQT